MTKKTKCYVFPTPSKCPRCKTIDTEAYSTNGNIQYRRCRRAVCRHRYSIFGTPVKKKKIINGKEKTNDKQTEKEDGQTEA